MGGLRKLNLGENYERGILSFLMKVSKYRHWLNLLNERRKTYYQIGRRNKKCVECAKTLFLM